MKLLTYLLIAALGLATGNTQAEEILRMSTTTSTENSGLLAELNPIFEKKYNIRLDVIAVGTGKALKLGENGDVDVVFVHAPEAEMEFVTAGFGIDRKAVMHNDFIIIGPKTDPSNVKNAATAIDAMKKISIGSTAFISRGDDSGTHKKELELWRQAGITPTGNGYIAAGQGMVAVIKIADEKLAYTLTDRGTYISFQDKTELQILHEGDKDLFNPYHIIAVNSEIHKHVRYDLAKKYIDFVISQEGQKLIADFKKNGQQLFYPDAGN